MMRSIMHCLLRSCFEDERDEQHEDSYVPPRPPVGMRRLSDSNQADANSDDDNDDDCCRPPDEGEQSALHAFWRNLRNSLRQYDSLEQVPRDEHSLQVGQSSQSLPPPPILSSGGPYAMFRRSSSCGSKAKSLDTPSKPANSPLRTAVSFQETSHAPVINPEEIVLPGSALQKLMAAHMSEAMEEMGDECVICMEGFDSTNPRMPTLCGCGENKTYFHLPCLYQWIEQSRNCPSCRKRLRWKEF